MVSSPIVEGRGVRGRGGGEEPIVFGGGGGEWWGV